MARLFCLAFLLTLTFASATPTDKGKGPAEQSFDHDPEVIRLRQRVDSLREALEAFLAGDAYRSLPDPNSLARFTASASDKKQNEAIQAVADEKLEKLEAAEAELAQLLSRLANPNMGFLSHPAAAGGSQWIPPPNGATAAAGTSVPKEADADVAAASRLKHLAYHNDAWVDPTTKKEKTGLKRQCTQLDNIFQQQQRIRQCISAERDARTTNAAQEDLEQTAKATDDAIRAGELLCEDFNKRNRKALVAGWDAVEALDVPDCCESEADWQKLMQARRRLETERRTARERATGGRGRGRGAFHGGSFSAGQSHSLQGLGANAFLPTGTLGGMQGLLPLPNLFSGQRFGGSGYSGGYNGGSTGNQVPRDRCKKCGEQGHWAKDCPKK